MKMRDGRREETRSEKDTETRKGERRRRGEGVIMGGNR